MAARAQGIKLELFIFDTFRMAENVALLEVRREEEFAPVKNAPGAPSDSPDTARRAILALHQRWVAPELHYILTYTRFIIPGQSHWHQARAAILVLLDNFARL